MTRYHRNSSDTLHIATLDMDFARGSGLSSDMVRQIAGIASGYTGRIW